MGDDAAPVTREETILDISRPAFSLAAFEEAHPRQPPPSKPTLLARLRKNCECSASCLGKTVLSKVPVINTMRNYQWKQWLLNDIIAGISIGVIHIPQGMGFSLLTSLPPVYGLYTSLFPVVIYFLFGTSHHISMGTMAITSLMIAAIIDQQVSYLGLPPQTAPIPGGDTTSNLTENLIIPATTMSSYGIDQTVASIDIISDSDNNNFNNASEPLTFDLEAFKVDIATSVTLLMGLWQVGLSLVNLGVVATFMSMTFIGGFLTGCAGHIVTSQVRS